MYVLSTHFYVLPIYFDFSKCLIHINQHLIAKVANREFITYVYNCQLGQTYRTWS